MRAAGNMLEDPSGDVLSHKGLSDREAKKKLEIHGLNTISEKKKISVLEILTDQFTDLMVLILLASTAISMFMGEMTEAVTIIAIVIVNAILGFVQEYRTEKTMEALKSLAAPLARVVRQGKPCSIPAEEVVPGDLILLEAGDRVPADAVLIESISMFADESLLTGESVPVEKEAGKGKTSLKGADKKSFVYMGTVIINGRAKAVVNETGMNTEMGKIADMLQNIESDDTPLQKKLEHLGKFIAYGCLAICAVVSLTGVLRGEDVFVMLLAGISLAVAAIPEGLPAIVTIALALGVQRMLKKNALIRKLPAVETLGCASVICSDKTGTLTENRMTVRKILAGGNVYEVDGSGYEVEGGFLLSGKRADPIKNLPLKHLLEICGLCNNAKLVRRSEKNGIPGKVRSMLSGRERWQADGDPTEGALLIAAAKAGITEEVLGRNYFRIDEMPFDSDRKCMTVICSNHKGERFAFTKGAPDIIINKCSRIFSAAGIVELTPSKSKAAMEAGDVMAGEALRVLGLAFRRLEGTVLNHGDVEKDLTFVGLAGMIDPPRQEALGAVQKCRMAGIKPVMITGDHKITASAIARELDICRPGDLVLTGADLDGISERKLEAIAENVSVYARVSPKNKLMIVRVLKRLGHIVAMTGDGVNDAPAVKEADIGVSMGISGTDVTKESSSMVLLDDNFATIVAAVEEGRVIYSNIRKFIRYMLSCNLGEVLTMFLGMLMGLPIPLMPIQILWVNLVTDGLPAIALGFDPPERDSMMRKPRGADENIFSGGLLNIILFRGILIGLSTLAVFATMLYLGGNVETARTGAFLTLVLTQLIHVFECKSEKRNIFEIPLFNNIWLVLAVICSLLMILAVIYLQSFQVIFHTVPLTMEDWLLVSGFSLLGPVAASFFRNKKV